MATVEKRPASSTVDYAMALYDIGLTTVGYGSGIVFLATTPEISPVKRLFAACAVGYVTRLCADFGGVAGMASGFAGGGLLGVAAGSGRRALRRQPEAPGVLGDVKTGAVLGIFGGLLAGTFGGFAGGAWGGYTVAKKAAIHVLAPRPQEHVLPRNRSGQFRQQLILDPRKSAIVRLLPD